MKMRAEQRGAGYGPQAAAMRTLPHAAHLYSTVRGPIQTPDVGTGIYMATARTMDPPQLRNEGHGRRGNDIGNEARNSR